MTVIQNLPSLNISPPTQKEAKELSPCVKVALRALLVVGIVFASISVAAGVPVLTLHLFVPILLPISLLILGVLGVLAICLSLLLPKCLAREPENTRSFPLNFQKEIEPLLTSDAHLDKPAFVKAFQKSFPQFEKMIQIIQTTQNSILQCELIQVLYVLAGIKPVFVFELGPSLDQEQIKEIAKCCENITFIKGKDGASYLINEKPLPEFNPRRFLLNFDSTYPSLEAAVCFAFPMQNEQITDQLLSYLLGFGPTWEAYAHKTKRLYLENHVFANSIFSDEHYLQLGLGCHRKDNIEIASREDLISKGKLFSEDAANHRWDPRNEEKKASLRFDRFTDEAKALKDVCMEQMIDPISYQSDYIQKAIMLRKKLLNFFEIKPLS